MVYRASSLDEIANVCQELIPLLDKTPVVLLNGAMGAGKTTFVAELCRQLGCTIAATSPTYALVNEYKTTTGKIIYHFDLYRLKSLEEALDIGIEEYLDSGNICLIEWPEIVLDLIYPPALVLNISNQSGIRLYDISTL